MRSFNTPARLLTAALTVAALAAGASAVQPQRWTHSSEADFQDGEVSDTVVTNLGDIKLATGSTIIGEMPEQASIIYALQRVADGLYLAAGPEGKLLRRDAEGELVEVLTLSDEQVFTLDRLGDELLVGVSGPTSRLAVLNEADELVTLVELPEVRYIWDTVVQDEAIYLATGTEGQVLRVARAGADAFGEPTVVLDANQTNVLTLAGDAEGRLYAGTDTDGLIYRLTPGEAGVWEPFVLYDAAEPEVAALLVLDDGTIYAGTADAEQARPGRLEEPVDDPAGRPDVPPVPAPDAPAEEDVPEPDDIPAVPPGADPIGDPEEEAPGLPEQPAPSDDAGDAPADDVDDVVEEPTPDPMRALIRRSQPKLPATARRSAQRLSEADEADTAGEAAAPLEQVEPAAGAPTAQQRDRLREQVRGQLQNARDTGTLQSGVQVAPGQPGRRAATPQRARPAATAQPTQPGNAIYRIDAQGFVNEVFRESVMVLKIVQAGNRLLVATGNEGQLFSVNPRTEEMTIIADLDPEQITSILVGEAGELLLGTANAAQLIQLDDEMATRGTYTSRVLDAEQISLFGTLRLTADIPQGTSVLVQTRTGNVGDPEHAPWTEWSEPHTFRHNADASALQPREVKTDAPPARFLQYRLTLLGDRDATPVVNAVETAYVMPNLPPRLQAVRASYPEPTPARGAASDESPPTTSMNVEWEATDANEDELTYKLEYQPAGSSRYILIEEDIRETNYEWQTRRVPDGRYVLRVTASDRPSNPPNMARTATRRSDAVLVDNSPPAFDRLEVAVDAGVVTVTGGAVDPLSTIQSISYAVDHAERYTPVLPEDLIFDSTRERFSVTIPDLASGDHVVTLRVQNTRGNTRHEAVMIEIE